MRQAREAASPAHTQAGRAAWRAHAWVPQTPGRRLPKHAERLPSRCRWPDQRSGPAPSSDTFFSPGKSLTCREERQASRARVTVFATSALTLALGQVLLLGLQTPLFRVGSPGQVRVSSGWNDRVRRGAEPQERGPCHAWRDRQPNSSPVG